MNTVHIVAITYHVKKLPGFDFLTAETHYYRRVLTRLHKQSADVCRILEKSKQYAM